VGAILPGGGVVDVHFTSVNIDPVEQLAGRIPAGTFSEIGFGIKQEGGG
jgi:hypothetical protein